MKEEHFVKRSSNLEMLRIIAMFMIVIWHFCLHGIQGYTVINELNKLNQFQIYLLKSITVIAVNLYIFISGYFLYNKMTSSLLKTFKIILETVAFSILIYGVLLILGVTDFSIRSTVFSFFPIFFGQYWFMSVYLILYLLTPFINIIVRNVSKMQHLYLITILFFIVGIWQFIFNLNVLGVNRGHSLFQFIFIYILAAYIGKYGFIVRSFNKKTYLLIFIITTSMNTVISYLTNGNFPGLFGYNNPLVILSTLSLFMFFKNMVFQSNIVNNISKYTLGVYLIHEHFLLRPILWTKFNIVERILSGSSQFLALDIIIFSTIIFSVCLVFSYLISVTFNFIFNVFIKKLCGK